MSSSVPSVRRSAPVFVATTVMLMFLRLFGLNSLEEPPEITSLIPSPELEEELRQRLLMPEKLGRARRLDPRRQLATRSVDLAAPGQAGDGGVDAVALSRALNASIAFGLDPS